MLERTTLYGYCVQFICTDLHSSQMFRILRRSHRIPFTCHTPCRAIKTAPIDWKPVKSNQKAGKSLWGNRALLGLCMLMPVVSFGLGTWQVKRLKWKTDLISKAENRLSQSPLALPEYLNPDVVDEQFDYRRVSVTGKFRHDQEMVVGPRTNNGREGYFVVTPLERENGTKLLIFRGWIAKAYRDKSTRPLSLVPGEQTIECVLRRKPGKNVFTVEGHPEVGEYHWMDIDEMARRTGSQPIFIQANENLEFEGQQLAAEQIVRRGIPLGTVPKIDFRNSHFQYIITWYGLSLFTAGMLVALLRKRNTVDAEKARKLAHARKFQ